MTFIPSALLTDLYQLTMMHAYLRNGMTAQAVFELTVRSLPARRGFLLAAGLDPALDYLESLRFSGEELGWLRAGGRFDDDFLEYLAAFRFTGSVHALPEGTVFFAGEPLLRVTAPLPEAQLVESRLMNLVHHPTLVASKAARCVLAAGKANLVDFGLRRSHGGEAGLLAARAAWIAGFAGSATLLAEKLWGIPAFGTMAHSFIEAHDDEGEAFENFARAQPANVTLLIDTYDTEESARRVAELVPRLAREGIAVRAVRLDSGDLAAHARRVRRILDEAGAGDVKIFASGGLDENAIRALVTSGAPIDGFGVGTHLVTSQDGPSLDAAYKLAEYDGRPRRKKSEGKESLPGRKQVWRQQDDAGRMRRDVVGLEGEDLPGTPLLVPVMEGGRRREPRAPLEEARRRAAEELASLPEPLRALAVEPAYPMVISPALRDLAARTA